MIKMPNGVDDLHWPALNPIFPIGLVKTESGFIVRSVLDWLREMNAGDSCD